MVTQNMVNIKPVTLAKKAELKSDQDKTVKP